MAYGTEFGIWQNQPYLIFQCKNIIHCKCTVHFHSVLNVVLQFADK